MNRKSILSEISVQEFSFEDIDPHVDYWYRSPSDLLKKMNVDINKMPSEKNMRELLEININENELNLSPILSIKHIDKTIGVHELTHLENNSFAIMHAHIWNENYRGIGVGSVSYILAMKIFFDRFKLKEIRFETPLYNKSAHRIKEKLGIKPSGFGVIDMPMLIKPQKTITYIVKFEDFNNIEKRIKNFFK